jgi:hypothetical protein
VTIKELLLAQYFWLPLAPVVISACGIAIAACMSRLRWLIHLLSVIAMLLLPSLSIHLREIADPTLIDGPGPGDGLILLLYLGVLAICLIAYGLAAAVIRARRSPNKATAKI